MKILLFLLPALLFCGVGEVCANDADSLATGARADVSRSYEDAKPVSLQGEKPVMPLKVDAGVLKLTFSGYAQASYMYDDGYLSSGRSNSFTADRLILMMNAEITQKIRMFVMYDARGSLLHEMYGEYAFCPELKVRCGAYKQPFMLENITSPTKINNLQINPIARYFAGMSLDLGTGAGAGRDLGLMLTGDLFPKDGRRLVNYSIGVFNGNYRGKHNTGFKDNNSQKDVVGMVNYLATKNLMFTCSFLFGTGHAIDAREGVYAKDQNYRRRRICGGVEWSTKPLHLRSEYVFGLDNNTHSQGVYLSGDIHVLPKFDIVFNYDYLDTGNLGADVHSLYLNNRTHTLVGGFSYNLFKLCRVVTEYTYAITEYGWNRHLWQTQLQVRF